MRGFPFRRGGGWFCWGSASVTALVIGACRSVTDLLAFEFGWVSASMLSLQLFFLVSTARSLREAYRRAVVHDRLLRLGEEEES